MNMRSSLFVLIIISGISVDTFVCPLQLLADTTTTNNATSEAATPTTTTTSGPIEVRIGFLVGRQRLKSDRVYSRPGRQLIHVFNYGIDKLNQQFYRTTTSAAAAAADVDVSGDNSTHQQHHNTDHHHSLEQSDEDDDQNDLDRANNGANRHIQQRNSTILIAFKPIVGETYGNESESIKQTIDLMLRQQVHAIIGPQETCQLEPHLASIFDTPMISHYCSHWAGALAPNLEQQTTSASSTSTFIQTKPPHWKIVQRVLTLVRSLLDSYDAYPQQLVLLYFKQQQLLRPSSADATNSTKQRTGDIPVGAPANNNKQTIEWKGQQQQQQLGATSNEAIQYKLIGELLDVHLRELLLEFKLTSDGSAAPKRPPKPQRRRRPDNDNNHKDDQDEINQWPSLTVLNWHTTFHYGYTRNPFRGLLRRHLFARRGRRQSTATNQVLMNQQQCTTTTTMGAGGQPTPDAKDADMDDKGSPRTGAIYIVVGHYYEHLGLMLTLDELGLLNDDDHSNNNKARRPTVVLGVDIEPYDERDDSVRFLRGLLMDDQDNNNHHNSNGSTANAGDSLNSMAARYNHYLGVFPSRPTRMAELLDEMRRFYNRTSMTSNSSGDGQAVVAHSQLAASSFNQATINESVLFTTRLLQFIRLPVEAFYLYDAIELLGRYFDECLRTRRKPLADCQSGRLMRAWFANRQFTSYIGQEASRFDDEARAEGSYTIIGRRLAGAAFDVSNEDEFNLVPIGKFVHETTVAANNNKSQQPLIELSVNSSELDRVWLPFWCHNNNQRLIITGGKDDLPSECRPFRLSASQRGQRNNHSANDETAVIEGYARGRRWLDLVASPLGLLCICLLSMGCLWLVLRWAALRRRSRLLTATGKRHFLGVDFKLLSSSVSAGGGGLEENRRWFGEQDEKNFLHIVQSLLLLPEALSGIDAKDDDDEDDNDGDKDANWATNVAVGGQPLNNTTTTTTLSGSSTDAIELHCHMFPFPSCKFVHWLAALHQLKEMLFQYQSSELSGNEKSSSLVVVVGGITRRLMSTFFRCRLPDEQRQPKEKKKRTGDGRDMLATTGAFFRSKHRGTQTLRLLLNKYKSINECLCNLNQSQEHQTIVKLMGVTLSQDIYGAKVAKLIVERPERNNLRVALRFLHATLLKAPETRVDCQSQTSRFKSVLLNVLVNDLLEGLEYLHYESRLGFHGELRITNCLVTRDWRLKLTGFHVGHLRRALGRYEFHYVDSLPKDAQTSQPIVYEQLIYSAPELLACHNKCNSLTEAQMRLADVYSLALVIYELLTGQEPWHFAASPKNRHTSSTWAKLLVERAKVDANFRPPLDLIGCVSQANNSLDLTNLRALIGSCWSHSPGERPQSIRCFRNRLESSAPFLVSSSSSSSTASSLKRVGINRGSNEHLHAPDELANRFYVELLEKTLACMGDRLDDVNSDLMQLKLSLLPKRYVASASLIRRRCSRQKQHHQHQQANEAMRQLNGVSLCMFKFSLLPEGNSDNGRDNNHFASSFKQLNSLIRRLDELVASYQNYIHLMDSQIDSMLRYLVIPNKQALDSRWTPATASVDDDDEQRTQARWATAPRPNGKQHDDPYHECRVLASFALQLIDLANEFKGRVQVKCGLHCGSVLATCMPSLQELTNMNDDAMTCCLPEFDTTTKFSCKTFALARYVLMGDGLQTVDLLEQTCQAQRVQISDEYHNQLRRLVDLSDVAGAIDDDLTGAGASAGAPRDGVGGGGGVNAAMSGLFWAFAGDTTTRRQLLLSSDQCSSTPSDDNQPTTTTTTSHTSYQRQGYIMIKRGTKISGKPGVDGLETYWLLNGPRLSASQKLMLSTWS